MNKMYKMVQERFYPVHPVRMQFLKGFYTQEVMHV